MTSSFASSLVLSATPADALIDVPRRLVVRGATPGAHVTLTARTPRAGGVVWQAQATFVADADGVVDASRDAPVGGSYRGVSAMGLIESQVPEDGKSRDVFPQPVMAPLVTTVVAHLALLTQEGASGAVDSGAGASGDKDAPESDNRQTVATHLTSKGASGAFGSSAGASGERLASDDGAHAKSSSRQPGADVSIDDDNRQSVVAHLANEGASGAFGSSADASGERLASDDGAHAKSSSRQPGAEGHVDDDNRPSVSVSFTQRLAAEGVTRHEVREDGLVGTLYLPPGDGPHPAVMILNGSGGGINEPRAALYASYGYAAFAFGYFKGPGLPDYISNTPLEYFAKGMDWLRRTVRPAHDFVALSGQSRGGELVLLLGAVFPEAVSAVIGYVPSALIHSAQNACDPALGREGPTWLLDGKPLPHIWENNRTASWAPFDEGPPPHRHAKAMLTALDDPEAVERARIPVEKIRGPVMLLSAQDDGSWPSSVYSRMVTQRLAEHAHSHVVEHLDFENAGHAIVFPYVPTTQLVYAHPVSGKISTGGGEQAANALADERSWTAVKSFLAQAVAARAQSQGQS